MYEFDIVNIYTGENRIVFGYTFEDALRRVNLAPADWGAVRMEYVD